MKRLLVSTTALVSIVASSAFADASKLDIKVNGLVNFEYGVRNQKADYKKNANVSANQKNSAFNNNARVSVSAIAQADAGFKYGAVAGLMTSAQQRAGKDNSTTDNTYIFVDSSLGRVEVGSNYSASKTMGITGGSVARGTGGVTGDWDSFVSWGSFSETTIPSASSTQNDFYNSTSLLSDKYSAAGNNSEATNKITYYTPQVAGFQLGVSYAPDSNVTGDKAPSNTSTNRTLKNLVNAGLTYNNTFDQITLGVSAVGSTGTVKKATTANATRHNFQSYAFGSSLSYSAFSVSGNWGTANKKFFTYDDKLNTGLLGDAKISKNVTFWSSAVAYVQGPFGVSANYYSSQSASKNKFNAWALSADYSLAPGITPYVEFVQFQAKPNKTLNATATKNKGNVFLVGTALSF